MAQKPLRPCRHPGCTVLVPDGYCDRHRPKDSRSDEAKSWHWMYLTPEWTDDLRPNQLLQEPFCRECARHGVRVPATEVDHIRPHRGDWAVFTDRGNLQSLCHTCHSRKTMAITEVLGLDAQGNIMLNPLYEFVEDENSTLEHVSGTLKRTENKMQNVFKLQLAGYRQDF